MSPRASPELLRDARLTALCEFEDDEGRKRYLRQHHDLVCADQVRQLTEAARAYLRVDLAQALRAGEAALAIAETLNDRESLARALRAKANALWFRGQCSPAAEMLDRAAGLFEEVGRLDELGRTLSTSIQPLILLGNYERALCNVGRAREIFLSQQDHLRLARLDLNAANIHHRQERFAQALSGYEKAYQLLLPHRDLEGIAVALHNMAVCLVSLDDFDRALDVYHQARGFFQSYDMPRLVFQADYNLAYLYYLRGDYEAAIERLRDTRQKCSADDPYHAALCDLDQSEIYLELNLAEEAERFASRAAGQFEQMGMGYETARALNNLGIALSQKRETRRALDAFGRAKAVFVKEGHQAGESLVDLYEAICLLDSGDLERAGASALKASRFFRSSGLRRKTALCDLLLCRVALSRKHLDAARDSCDAAFRALDGVHAPLLNYQAHYLSGRIQEESGRHEMSADTFRSALRELETLRSSLQGEELKISFMTNKADVYERLIHLAYNRGSSGSPAEEAFLYMDRAKCRGLVDALFGRAAPLTAHFAPASRAASEIGSLRGRLNWFYHRIDSEQLQPEGISSGRVELLWKRARDCENELLGALRELPSAGGGRSDRNEPEVLTLPEIRAALEPGSSLVEYFQLGEQIVAAVLTTGAVEVVPLGPAARVRSHLRMLQFQLSKFHLGPSYTERFQAPLTAATQRRLRELHQDLIAPLEDRLSGEHLILAPHGFLHYLPIHALYDGQDYLIDRFNVSYTPSASVYALARRRASQPMGRSLILGIPDPRTPWILREAREVATVLPQPALLLAEQATKAALQEWGHQSRVIHITTHGVFRADNPMFSAVRLGDSYLNLYELYHFWLPAELLTLSGCNTGLNVVAAGDELIGLARGLLYAGARTLLLTLWDVHDRSTAEFMRSFYLHWGGGLSKAAALRRSMRELRECYPHPYYWAPFTLVGAGE